MELKDSVSLQSSASSVFPPNLHANDNMGPLGIYDTRFPLNTGASIPALGLGTWQSAPGEVKKAVSHALQNGYTHVGHDPKFPKRADSCRDLDKTWSHKQTWLELEKLLKNGKVKAIGVANYSVQHLEELLLHAMIIPAVNQIENDPSLPQQEFVRFCKEKGIHITAYSPLGSSGSPMLKAEAVFEVAKKRNVIPPAVLLGYHIARGNSVLTKSVNPDRIKRNIESLVNLDENKMRVFNSYSSQLQKEGKLTRYVYPTFEVDFGFPDKS